MSQLIERPRSSGRVVDGKAWATWYAVTERRPCQARLPRPPTLLDGRDASQKDLIILIFLTTSTSFKTLGTRQLQPRTDHRTSHKQNASKGWSCSRSLRWPAATAGLHAQHHECPHRCREQNRRDCRIILCRKRSRRSKEAHAGNVGRHGLSWRGLGMRHSLGKHHADRPSQQAGVAFLHSSWSEVLLPP